MTPQEVEKMINVAFYRLGLDKEANFYACYLWWRDGEQAADDWIRRYKGDSFSYAPGRPRIAYPGSPEQRIHREAEEEMERFFAKEHPKEPHHASGVWLEIQYLRKIARAAEGIQILNGASAFVSQHDKKEIVWPAIAGLGAELNQAVRQWREARAMWEGDGGVPGDGRDD